MIVGQSDRLFPPVYTGCSLGGTFSLVQAPSCVCAGYVGAGQSALVCLCDFSHVLPAVRPKGFKRSGILLSVVRGDGCR